MNIRLFLGVLTAFLLNILFLTSSWAYTSCTIEGQTFNVVAQTTCPSGEAGLVLALGNSDFQGCGGGYQALMYLNNQYAMTACGGNPNLLLEYACEGTPNLSPITCQ